MNLCACVGMEGGCFLGIFTYMTVPVTVCATCMTDAPAVRPPPVSSASYTATQQAHDVVVVAPRCDPRCGDVARTACDSPLLHSMRVVPTLADALADCTCKWGWVDGWGGCTGCLIVSFARCWAWGCPLLLPPCPLPLWRARLQAASGLPGGRARAGSCTPHCSSCCAASPAPCQLRCRAGRVALAAQRP